VATRQEPDVDEQVPPAYGERGETVAAPGAPRTPTERTLGDIWSDVLGVDDVRVGDDFFELGGDSMLALQVLWRLEECFDVELPLRALFAAATLAELAETVEASVRGPDTPS
jgi:acyl carrier protein